MYKTSKKTYYNQQRKEAFLDQKFPDANAEKINEEKIDDEPVVVSDKRRRANNFLKKLVYLKTDFKKI